MKFIGVREFRTRSAEIWKRLRSEKNMIVTSNGKPIAVLTATSENRLLESVRAIRGAEAREALASLRADAAERGLDRLTDREIDREIAAVRKKKKSK